MSSMPRSDESTRSPGQRMLRHERQSTATRRGARPHCRAERHILALAWRSLGVGGIVTLEALATLVDATPLSDRVGLTITRALQDDG
jgi:hypothetical protein